jgi:hypothetical protein
MTTRLEPSGYDVTKSVDSARSDCLITVGFDKQQGHISRFPVRLHYRTGVFPMQWTAVARFDHNESVTDDRDIYTEGLHIDIDRESSPEVTLHPRHAPLARDRGLVIRRCVQYLDAHAGRIVDIYEERTQPSGMPGWPDSGRSGHRFMSLKTLPIDMSREELAQEPLSMDEFDEFMAAESGLSIEEFRRQADEIEIGPLKEAELVKK